MKLEFILSKLLIEFFDSFNYYKINQVDSFFNSKIKILSNAVDIETYNLNEKNLTGSINIGFIGRWSEEKRPQLFLDIANKLQSVDISFFMAGSGMNGHRESIEKSGVGYIGSINDKGEINNLYKSLHYLIITSTYEGFPMVIMESMPYGVIPICTDVGGISEHITTGENGWLVNNQNPDKIVSQMIDAIQTIENTNGLRDKLSYKAQDYAIDNFGKEAFVKGYQNLLIL